MQTANSSDTSRSASPRDIIVRERMIEAAPSLVNLLIEVDKLNALRETPSEELFREIRSLLTTIFFRTE